jgi:hypothetical protein
MEQHPVPQNVTTFQFRLIGDMTLKQFGYLAVCSIIAFCVYKIPLPGIFTIPLAICVFLFGFGLAFVPVEERPMDVWVFSFIKSIYKPTLYVWQREKPIAEPVETMTTTTNPVTTTLPTITMPPKTPATATLPTVPSTPAVPILKPTAPAVHPAIPFVQPKSNSSVAHIQPLERPIVQVKHIELPKNPIAPTPTITPPKPALPIIPKSSGPSIAHHIQPSHTKGIFSGFFSWFNNFFTTKSKNKPVVQAIPAVAKPNTNPQVPSIPNPSIVGKTTNVSTTGIPVTITSPVKSVVPIPGNTPVKITPPDTQGKNELDLIRDEQKTTELENKLVTLQNELQNKSVSENRLLELQKQLSEVLADRNKMEAELKATKEKLSQISTVQPQKIAQPINPTPTQSSVRVITSETAVKAGLPRLTTFPNVVTGIIKDHENNLLPGVIVTVRDKDGMPLRALKTNKLGQFAASTPLPNNTYYLEVEDPRNRYVFDRIQISLNGGLVPAVEVIAKSQKELSREKLAKEIFGAQSEV